MRMVVCISFCRVSKLVEILMKLIKFACKLRFVDYDNYCIKDIPLTAIVFA